MRRFKAHLKAFQYILILGSVEENEYQHQKLYVILKLNRKNSNEKQVVCVCVGRLCENLCKGKVNS